MTARTSEPAAATAPRPSVCIVTSELVGPFANGGIGTSMTGLAQLLAASGFPVTILYTGANLETQAERRKWRRLYARIGIEMVWLVDLPSGRFAGPVERCGFTAPWRIYAWLRDHPFEVVQFNDCMGEGFYCLAMRRLGAAFADTTMFVALHSPSQWIFEINRTLPNSLLHAAFNQAERISVTCADLLWGPSQYLIDWARDHGFALPATHRVQKYVMPTIPLFDPPATVPSSPGAEPVRPREIVFFGRLEERKGLRTFCQALRQLNDLLAAREIKVTFLGREGAVAGGPALDHLAEEAKSWRFRSEVIADFGQQEALAHLMSGGCLAIMASPADNSPCTIYEALALGIPFIAARTGGIPELIDARDHDRTLFAPDAAKLPARIEEAIRSGIAPARAVEAPEESARRWIATFENWRELAAPRPVPAAGAPRIVAVIDAPAGTDLSATLASLAGVADIVLVSRGSARAAPEGLSAVEANQPERLAALLSEVDADLVLFVRGGAVLLPGALVALGRLLHCPGADGLVPAAIVGPDAHGAIVPPLGGSQSFAFFEGAMPGGAMIVRRAPLVDALVGCAAIPEAEFFGLPDLAIAKGLDLWPYAEPLIRHPDGPLADPFGTHAAERIRAYSGVGATELYYIAAIGHGRAQHRAGRVRALKVLHDRLVAWRFGWVVRLAERVLPRRLLRRLRRG